MRWCTRSDRGGNGGGRVQSRCMNHDRCRIRGSSYSRYVRKKELWVQVVNWKQFNPDEMLNNQESLIDPFSFVQPHSPLTTAESSTRMEPTPNDSTPGSESTPPNSDPDMEPGHFSHSGLEKYAQQKPISAQTP